VIRRLFLLVALLVGLGFAAGVYVAVIKTRWFSMAPASTIVKAPSTPEPARQASKIEPEPEPLPPTPRVVRPLPARRVPALKPGLAPPAPTPAPAAMAVGLLTIDSDVSGAQVFVDRQFVGTTPVKAHEVPAGTHTINVSAPGHEGVAETIEVAPGPREILIKLRQVRLEAALDVIHKHRFGSCAGRLVATAQGLRYDTSDRDDSFELALSDFETIEVDYLKKNLKIKVRKGRSYDFTDPGGNADHLFVFHRDVVKARDRLLKGDQPAATP
jgi:PEGA domain